MDSPVSPSRFASAAEPDDFVWAESAPEIDNTDASSYTTCQSPDLLDTCSTPTVVSRGLEFDPFGPSTDWMINLDSPLNGGNTSTPTKSTRFLPLSLIIKKKVIRDSC